MSTALDRSSSAQTVAASATADTPSASGRALGPARLWRRLRDGGKTWINRGLELVNLRLSGLTAERVEDQRLSSLAESGYFDRPAFPLPRALLAMNPTAMFEAIEEHLPRFMELAQGTPNDVGFRLDNQYFSSPDAEALYAMVRRYRPPRIVEIGSGHSTRLIRQAILDGKMATRLTCIDPCPRTEVSRSADEIFFRPVEELLDEDVFRSLERGDILFIDSSHELRPGNDCVGLLLRVLPALPSGVLIHVHDVFLPYDYPRQWMRDAGGAWSEQYVVQALLMGNDFDVLWASHWLMHSDERLTKLIPAALPNYATSLWLQKR